jgi:hypothetical protein
MLNAIPQLSPLKQRHHNLASKNALENLHKTRVILAIKFITVFTKKGEKHFPKRFLLSIFFENFTKTLLNLRIGRGIVILAIFFDASGSVLLVLDITIVVRVHLIQHCIDHVGQLFVIECWCIFMFVGVAFD